MTDAQLGELIEGIATNEGVALEVSVRTAAAGTPTAGGHGFARPETRFGGGG